MSFLSTSFFIFLFVGVIVYYIMPKKYQWIWLLLLSYYYYLSSGVKTIGFILFTTITTFVGAICIEKISNRGADWLKENKGNVTAEEKKSHKASIKRKKRIVVVVMLLLNFGLLGFMKYFDFAFENINAVISRLAGIQLSRPGIDLLLPLGISFYTFQSMGYIIDIYQGKYEADKNIFKFALFVSFFPQILQGPIGRYNKLAHQFYEKHYFNLTKIQHALQLILWGLFKKIVIADRAGVVVSKIFDNVGVYEGIPVVFGVLCYCIQLYGDFSGGMDVVMGCAQLFGIKLDANFRQPFFSHSISEFWRRWHITLGTWMKDYIFYPFSLSKAMNKFGKFSKKRFGNTVGRALPICVADLLIFFIVGVWHGAAWQFIVYGLYNGFIIAISSLLEPVYEKLFKLTHINSQSKVWRGFQILRTFILVNIGWYFDRAESLKMSLHLMVNTVRNFTFTSLTDGSLLKLGVGQTGLIILTVSCFVWLIVSILKEKNISIREAIDTKPLPIRWAIYILLVMSLPILGNVAASTGGFIYAQF